MAGAIECTASIGQARTENEIARSFLHRHARLAAGARAGAYGARRAGGRARLGGGSGRDRARQDHRGPCAGEPTRGEERKRVVKGTSVVLRVDIGGGRSIKKKKYKINNGPTN